MADTKEKAKQVQSAATRNMLVSVFANGLYLVTRIAIPPIALSYLDLEVYGIWTICMLIIGYFGMGAFGISNAYIRYTGVYFTRGDIDGVSRLISTGLAITCSFAALVLIGMWFAMGEVVDFFAIPEHLKEMAIVLIYGTIAVFMFDLSLGAFAYVLTGLNRLFQERMVWIGAVLMEGVVILVFVDSMGIYAFLMAFALRYLVTVSIYMVLCFKTVPGLRVGPSLVDKKYVKDFVHFGGIVQLTGMLAMFAGSIERLVASKYLGTEIVALFDLGQKFPQQGTSIPAAVNHAIFPAATHLQHGDHQEEIATLYIKGCRFTTAILGLMFGYMAIFSTGIVTAWLGYENDYTFAAFLMALYTIPIQLHTATGPATAIFKGIGEPLKETLNPVLQIVFYGTSIGIGFAIFGISAKVLAVSVALGMLLSSFTYLMFANHRLNVHFGRFLRRVLLPAFIPYLIAGVFGLATLSYLETILDQRLYLAGVLLVIGIVYTLICLAIYMKFLAGDEEKKLITGAMGKVTKRFRKS
jgi:O-antigen/teichoic acid export membrane protein